MDLFLPGKYVSNLYYKIAGFIFYVTLISLLSNGPLYTYRTGPFLNVGVTGIVTFEILSSLL